jgi:two-component system, cell cycle sensor histidine kinase and response regulator CckA
MPVNRLVTESAALLKRLLGSHIELKIELAPEAGRVRAGVGQLQQILMNLAANARDGMPSGGRLTIHASPTGAASSAPVDTPSSAKQYVTLQVADTAEPVNSSNRPPTSVHGITPYGY